MSKQKIREIAREECGHETFELNKYGFLTEAGKEELTRFVEQMKKKHNVSETTIRSIVVSELNKYVNQSGRYPPY